MSEHHRAQNEPMYRFSVNHRKIKALNHKPTRAIL